MKINHKIDRVFLADEAMKAMERFCPKSHSVQDSMVFLRHGYCRMKRNKNPWCSWTHEQIEMSAKGFRLWGGRAEPEDRKPEMMLSLFWIAIWAIYEGDDHNLLIKGRGCSGKSSDG